MAACGSLHLVQLHCVSLGLTTPCGSQKPSYPSSALRTKLKYHFLCGQTPLNNFLGPLCSKAQAGRKSVVVSRKQGKGEEKRVGRPPDLNRLRENLLKEQLGKAGRRERDPDSDSDYLDKRRGSEEGRTSRYDDDGGRQWQEKRGGNGNRFSEQVISGQRGAEYAERRGGSGARQEEALGRTGERAPFGVNRRGGGGRYGRGSFGQGSYGRGRGSRYGSGREDDYRDGGRYRQGGESRLERGGRGPRRGYQDWGRGPQGGSRGRGLAPVAGAVGMDRRQTALSFSDDEEYEEGDSDFEEEDDDELPPDTFFMKDAQGDDVVVIGHEDLDPKQLSPDMLTWTPIKQLETEVTKDGNMEEDDWWKLMDGDAFMGEDWKAPWAKKGDGDEDEEDFEEDDEDVAVEEIDEETAVKLFGKEGAARLFSGEADEDVYFEVEEEIDDETGEIVEVYDVKEVGRVQIDSEGAVDITADPTTEPGVGNVLAQSQRDLEGAASISGSAAEVESVNALQAEESDRMGASEVPSSHVGDVSALGRGEEKIVVDEAGGSERSLHRKSDFIAEAAEASSPSERGSANRGAEAEGFSEDSSESSDSGVDSDGEWSGQAPGYRVFGKTFGRKRKLGALPSTTAEPIKASELVESLNDEWRRVPVAEPSAEVSTSPDSAAGVVAETRLLGEVKKSRNEAVLSEGFEESEGLGTSSNEEEGFGGPSTREHRKEDFDNEKPRTSSLASEGASQSGSEREMSGSLSLEEPTEGERLATSTRSAQIDSASDEEEESFSAASPSLGGEELKGPPKKSKKDLRKEAAQVPHLGSGRSNYKRALAEEFFSKKSFTVSGASEDAAVALAAMGVLRPSHIQALAFKPVLDASDCIIADQTGSGKTLAYLAPIVQRLRDEEVAGAPRAAAKKPKVLVLTPTSELAAQVLSVARSLSSSGAMPFRSVVITGGYKWKTQVDALQAGAEMVIATPGRLAQHIEKGTVLLEDVKTIVVDEVDVLFDDDDFGEFLRPLRESAPPLAQYIFVTATLPLDVHERLLSEFPFATSVLGPNLHTTSSGLREILVDCSGGDEVSEESGFERKKDALIQIMGGGPKPVERARSDDDEEWNWGRERSAKDRREARRKSGTSTAKKTLVFCNKIDTCRKVENALKRRDRGEADFEVLAYHAALSQDVRQANMQRFLQPVSGPDTKPLVMICTDRASRGVDSADVEQVVLFDFPREPSEYVRRVGRTARGAGGTGTVYVLVLGRQVAIARKILDRNERGEPVHQVPAAIV